MQRAKDYDEDIEELLDAAEGSTRNGREEDFVADLRDKYEDWGEEMYLSERQYNWLLSIAER